MIKSGRTGRGVYYSLNPTYKVDKKGQMQWKCNWDMKGKTTVHNASESPHESEKKLTKKLMIGGKRLEKGS